MAINWAKASYSTQAAEFDRIVGSLAGGNANALVDMSKMVKDAYQKGSLNTLTPTIWAKLQNTNSWMVKSLGQVFMMYGAEPIEVVLKEILKGSVPAPTILEYNAGRQHILVTGDATLMLCRALGVPAKVVIVKL